MDFDFRINTEKTDLIQQAPIQAIREGDRTFSIGNWPGLDPTY